MSGYEGFYVYGLFKKTKNKKINKCFYIGKGSGKRMNEHFHKCNLDKDDCVNLSKVEKITKIKSSDDSLHARKIFKELSEEKAYELEEELINEIGINNLTNKVSGGKFLSPRNNKKLSNNEVKEIKWLLNNTKLYRREIANKYNISCYHITDINRGLHWNNITDEKKPVWFENYSRKNGKKKKKFPKDKLAEVKWILNNTELSNREIEDEYNFNRGFLVSKKSTKQWASVSEAEPAWHEKSYIKDIINKREPGGKLKVIDVKEIKWLLDYTGFYLTEIADFYNTTQSSISSIKNETRWSKVDEKIKPDWYKKNHEEKKKNSRRMFKLSIKDVKEIKWLLNETEVYQKDIAKKYNVSKYSISKINMDDVWKNVNDTLRPDWFE